MADIEVAREWLRFAHTDLSAALYLQGHRPIPAEIICYHCQQAAEKAIKAVLAYHYEDIPHIHDLTKLLVLAAECDQSLLNVFKQANRLSNYAVFSRYPGGVEISEDDMKTALMFSDEILTQVEILIPDGCA
jgi:HEPN domain-containing protein